MNNSETKQKIVPVNVLSGESPLVLTAILTPVGELDRFQPAGFPEVGHVTYKAPRSDGSLENVCIVDSAASMANHLESVCLHGAHDLDLVEDLNGMPYLRCVTGQLEEGKIKKKEVVVTSLTEGHRIASSYFLDGEQLESDTPVTTQIKAVKEEVKKLKAELKNLEDNDKKEREKKFKMKDEEAKKIETETLFQNVLIKEFGIELRGSSRAHPPADKWWDVFKAIFRYDPNSLVHGVLFPQWQIKIPRFLTAHLEAFGASRVDRSGVKFDRLGKTTSGQPIFAVDDATAREIRATFILDLNLVRSFGRKNDNDQIGLSEKQKEFLVALALWKITRLLDAPFRFRSGCHLSCASIKCQDKEIDINDIDVDIRKAIEDAGFTTEPRITDIYWPREEIYREGKDDKDNESDKAVDDQEDDEQGEET